MCLCGKERLLLFSCGFDEAKMWGFGSLQNIEPTKTQFLYINRSDVPTNGKNDRPKNDRQHRYATKDRVNDREVTARLHRSDGKLKKIDEWVE